MLPLLDQSHLDVAWHAGQYQALPPVYVQNSALEIAWTRVVEATGTREGRVLAPFLTEGYEGLNIDDEDDFALAETARRERAGDAARRRARAISCRVMKLASLETLSCDAGWRPWLFVKATTDDGLVGWSEVTDSHGSPTGLAGVVRDLAPLVVGRDPRAVEAIHWDLYRRTRQSPGSIVQKAIGGIENALLDLKGEGARRLGRRALRRADAGDDPALLVALRHDARPRVGGDRHAEARLVRRGRRARRARSSSGDTARSRPTSSSRETSRAC